MGIGKIVGKAHPIAFWEELWKNGYHVRKYLDLPDEDRFFIYNKWTKCFEQTVPNREFNEQYHINIKVPREKEKFFRWLKRSKYHNLILDDRPVREIVYREYQDKFLTNKPENN